MATSVDAEITEAKVTKKRRKRGRFIKQGYHKYERDDARRVAAKAFLSGIPLDADRQPLSTSPNESMLSQLQQEALNLALTPAPNALVHTWPVDIETPVREVPLGSPLYSRHLLSPKHSRSIELESPTDSVFMEPGANVNEVYDKRFSSHRSNVCVCHNLYKMPSTMLMDKQLIFTSSLGAPFAVSSVITYKREDEWLKQDNPQRARTRINSMSVQIDLDVDLGTTSNDNIEVSLGHLFAPVWVMYITPEHTPPMPHKLKTKRHPELRPPAKLVHWKAAGSSYPWAFFREQHSALHVTTSYHPQCLDNHEFFVGSQTHSIRLEGKVVSVIQYARPGDVKRAMNEEFAKVFPHVRLTLSKLRSIKRELHKAAEECDVELEAVAYSYVYFERLVLTGKINKANRKIIAGVCLLLAVKFYTDVKQKDIKGLVDRLADQLHLSTKELVLYEFPVLVSLQFSLVVPAHQAQHHMHTLN